MNTFYSCLIDEIIFRIYFDLNFIFGLDLNPYVLHIFTSFMFSFSNVIDLFHSYYKFKMFIHFWIGLFLSNISQHYTFLTSTIIHIFIKYFLLLLVTCFTRIFLFFASQELKDKFIDSIV